MVKGEILGGKGEGGAGEEVRVGGGKEGGEMAEETGRGRRWHCLIGSDREELVCIVVEVKVTVHAFSLMS